MIGWPYIEATEIHWRITVVTQEVQPSTTDPTTRGQAGGLTLSIQNQAHKLRLTIYNQTFSLPISVNAVPFPPRILPHQHNINRTRSGRNQSNRRTWFILKVGLHMYLRLIFVALRYI